MFERDNIFRLKNVDGHHNPRDPRIDICVEFFRASSCPCLKLWVEKHHPPRYDHQSEEWHDEHLEIAATLWVYGRNLIDNLRTSNASETDRIMSAWWPAEALANGSVSGKDASNLAHQVLTAWVVRAPKEFSKEIAEAAPGWWGRITSTD